MRRPRSKWRRTLIFLGIILILALVGIVSLPVWFPWLARPVARSLGFEFEHYRSVGFARFEVTGVVGNVGTVKIAAERLEAFLPHAWLWELWFGGDQEATYASVSHWTLDFHSRGADDPPGRERSAFRILEGIEEASQLLQSWVPSARLRDGIIHSDGRVLAEVPQAVWRTGRLKFQVTRPDLASPSSGWFDAARPGRWQLNFEGGMPDLAIESRVEKTSSSWLFKGEIQWRTNLARFAARFDERGLLPAEATISGTNVNISAEALGLPPFGKVRGGFTIRTAAGQFNLETEGEIEPGSAIPGEAWPSLEFGLTGHGGLRSATIDALAVRAPGLSLQLKSPMALNYAHPIVADRATFELDANLDGVHPGWRGGVNAELDIEAGTNQYPVLAVHAKGAGILVEGLVIDDLEGRGSMAWPLFELEEARVVLGTNSIVRVRGGMDLQKHELEKTTLEWEAHDLSLLLPESVGVEGFKARIQAEGPLDQLRHQGEIQADRWSVPPFNPLSLSFQWDGVGFATVSFTGQTGAGESRLLFSGQLKGEGPSLAIDTRLDTFVFERQGRTVYRLNNPAMLRWQSTARSNWNAQVDAFALKSDDGRLLEFSGDTAWPAQGHVQLKVHNLSIAEAREFWPAADLPFTLASLNLAAGWTNGPIAWSLDCDGRLGVSDLGSFLIGARARGDGSGTYVEKLTVQGTNVPPLTIRGVLPMTFDNSGLDLVEFLPDAPLEFEISHESTNVVAFEFGAGDKLELNDPQLDLRITGTAAEPQGKLSASLSGAKWRSSRGEWVLPRIENAKLEAELRPALVQLNRLEFELDGQPVRIEGAWPLATDAWEELFVQGTMPGWEEASGRVIVEGADLAPVAQHLPTLLTSQGQLHLDLTIRPGPSLEGFMALTNAMTRPLGPLAPVREIEALIVFSGRTARVDRFTGRLGGSPIYASGQATIGDAWEPQYRLHLLATNAPLVREPGLLLRANLDLNLENQAGQNPAITGSVQLRDGLLLQDVSSLLVDRLERPAIHPPYFSLTNLPFARWPLDVKVTGDRFLRVRSPAFVGSVSASGEVQGSLGRPVIRADLRLPSGRILFPFGKLEVERAYATLNGEDPRGPVMDVLATGPNYNYNVRLEVTGTMDNLNVLFTSTPPLSSEEILLMLTAGELPNQEITYSAEARAGRLITYLGREVVTRFFGDEMSEERIIIDSGQNIARSGRTTYSVEYRITPRWSLVGEYDQFNALNAGLKWRIYSR